MSGERFQSKDTLLTTFADECSTLLLGLATLTLPAFISQFNDAIGLATLATGATLTATSFVAGRIINRIHSGDNLPKKPLAAENPTPVNVARLTTIKITS